LGREDSRENHLHKTTMKTKSKSKTEEVLSKHLTELTIIAATAIDELTIKYGDDYGKTLNRQLSRVLGKIRSGK
jgi:hypothetical protein